MPGPPPVMRDDEVVELDDAAHHDDEGGDEDRAHHRDDDEEVGLPHRDAVDARRLPDVLVDAAQAGEHQAHDEAGALPEPGDDQAVEHEVGVVERIEGEALPAEAANTCCTPKSGLRIHCQTRPVTMKESAKG